MAPFKYILLFSACIFMQLDQLQAQHSDFRRMQLTELDAANNRDGHGPIEIDTRSLRKLNPADATELIHADSTGRFVLGLSANKGMLTIRDTAQGESFDLTTLKRMPVELPKFKSIPKDSPQPNDNAR